LAQAILAQAQHRTRRPSKRRLFVRSCLCMVIASPSGSCDRVSPSSDEHRDAGREDCLDAGREGVDPETLFRRRFGGLIWAVGLDLRMSPVTIATAALYFQRFFLVEKRGDFDAMRIAIACAWLASKVREEAYSLRDIVNAFAVVDGRAEESKALQMEAYWALRDEVVLHEQAVLRAMAFDVEPTPAYTFLLEFAWLMNFRRGGGGLTALAWTLLNDSFCSDICVARPPERVALACLLLSVELGRRKPLLQEEAEHTVSSVHVLFQEPRMEDFLGLGRDSGGCEIEAICQDLLAVYEANVPEAVPRPRKGER